jgi:hypothetical protein
MKTVLVLLAEISGLLIIFALFLLVLGYFKIITLPNLLPKTITSIMKTINSNTNVTNTNQPQAQPTIGYNTMQTISMGSCPLPEGCKNAELIGDSTESASQNFSGLGFNLSGSNSAILAMREGKISMRDTIENGENLTVVTITDPANIQEYVYKFNKTAYLSSINSENVTEGQKIGNLQNKGAITYQSKSYSFILSMYSLISKQYLKLQSSTDGLRIETPSK